MQNSGDEALLFPSSIPSSSPSTALSMQADRPTLPLSVETRTSNPVSSRSRALSSATIQCRRFSSYCLLYSLRRSTISIGSPSPALTLCFSRLSYLRAATAVLVRFFAVFLAFAMLLDV